MKKRIIAWLLDRLDADTIFANVRKRGWVAVPRDHALAAFPEEASSGWWPVRHGDVIQLAGDPKNPKYLVKLEAIRDV